jgi:uncharacterized membrane protein HdeD (DUF308 family)
MTLLAPAIPTPATASRPTAVRPLWGWVLALGIVLIVTGGLACAFAFTATLATVLALGILLLLAGGFQFGTAVWARDRKRFFLFLLTGVLCAVAGVMMVEHPVATAEGLTLMLTAAFLAGGMFRVIAAATHDFPGRGWMVVNGVVTLILGLLIWRQWPVSGLWVIGLFAGIDLVTTRIACVLLAGPSDRPSCGLERRGIGSDHGMLGVVVSRLVC